MGIADHLTCLLRNLYASQEATVRTGCGTTDWFQIGLDGHEFEQAPGAGDGHGSLASFRPRGPKESDTTEQLN